MKKEPLSDSEYQELKKFLGFYFEYLARKVDMPAALSPVPLLESFEQKSMAKARMGLQQAINDIVEETSHWGPKKIAIVDSALAELEIISLTEIRRRYSRKYLSLLERGVIRTETEYYFVKGIVDGGSIEPGATESEKLQAMLYVYETRPAASLKQKLPPSE
jgi:hypothetical protein